MNLRDRLNAALSGVYVLDREIGGGGMSSVFVAHEKALGREVVLKVLPPELAAEVSEDRFRREILLAARLQHPHIVPIFTAGEADGLLYYTMPLVEGETLRARLTRDGELPVSDAIRVLSCIADAMAYAHAHNVVHRDIKPENILLSGQHAVVTDFGVAKALGDASSTTLTGTGIAIGTAAYMAPEQVAADPGVDHRVDIYALGIVAYELLVGATPFSGRTMQQVAAAHLTQAPEAITTKRAAIPDGLATLVMSCLEKRPSDRPQSAEFLARELSQLAVSGGQAASVRGAPRRKRTIAVAAAGVLAATALGAAFMIFGNRKLPNEVSGQRVVVAALTNETGDNSLASFGKMAADWVTQGLQETGFIDVVDSRTVLQASQQLSAGEAPLVEALARQTSAALVVWGSYYIELDSLIVRAQIVNAADGKVLRTVSVGRVSRRTPTLALETLRDQVLAALAPLVDPRLATWETSLKPPSYAAYRVYMDGLENYVKQNNGVTYDSSAVQFANAVQLDSTFQTARLWEAFTLFLAGWTSSPGYLKTADSVISVLQVHRNDLSPYDRRFFDWFLALRRNDIEGTYKTAGEMMKASPGAAHAIWETAVAAVRTNRPKAALQLLDRPELSTPKGSLSMQPYANWKAEAFHMTEDYNSELQVGRTYAVPYIEARAQVGLGNGAAAVPLMQPILESATIPPAAIIMVCRLFVEELMAHGQIEVARAFAAKVFDAFRTDERFAKPSPFSKRGAAGLLYGVGRFSEARAMLDSMASLDSAAFRTVPDELNVRGLLAVSAARTGDRATAQRIAAELEARKLDVVYKPLATHWRARIAAAVGDKATAATLLRRAVAEGFLPVVASAGAFFHTDPDLRDVLSTPEIRALTAPKN